MADQEPGGIFSLCTFVFVPSKELPDKLIGEVLLLLFHPITLDLSFPLSLSLS